MSPAVTPPPPVLALERPAPAAASDPLRAAQPFLSQINWTPPPARSPRPLVAVLDTGVDATAPDLAEAVRPGSGRSFVTEEPDPLVDAHGHGTHVAGVIAATSGNAVGGSGVSSARILPVTIADADGRTTTSALVRGLRYATAQGARVINVSFGGSGFSRREQAAIDDASRAGALVVVAVGNAGGGGGPPPFPGAYRQVMAVAAVGAGGRPLALSERGPQVSLAAPGQDVASVRAGPPGRTAALVARSGTSVAAAIASGAAARLMAQRPGITAPQVRALLESTAHDVPPTGPDSATGMGLIDLAAALAAPTPAPRDPEPNDDTALAAGTPALPLGPAPAAARATGTVGSWSDPRDGFPVRLVEGDIVTVHLVSASPGNLALALWRPGTPGCRRDEAFLRRWLLADSQGIAPSDTIAAVVPRTGVYTLEVQGVRVETGYAPTLNYSVTVDTQIFRRALGGSTMVQR